MQREPRATWMITSRRIEQQDVGMLGQRPHGLLHERANPQGHQARHIGRTRRTVDHLMFDHLATRHAHCSAPRRIMISTGPNEPAWKAPPATADDYAPGIQDHLRRLRA